MTEKTKSLLEQLPSLVAAGKRQAEQILDELTGQHRIGLQTRELVFPSRILIGSICLSKPKSV